MSEGVRRCKEGQRKAEKRRMARAEKGSPAEEG
jgi:hypothetical protein